MTRWRWISLVILLGAVYFALAEGEFSEWTYLAVGRKERASGQQLQRLKHEVDSLRAFHDSLENDPAVQERYAREQWGMLRPGELVFTIVAPDSTAADTGH